MNGFMTVGWVYFFFIPLQKITFSLYFPCPSYTLPIIDLQTEQASCNCCWHMFKHLASIICYPVHFSSWGVFLMEFGAGLGRIQNLFNQYTFWISGLLVFAQFWGGKVGAVMSLALTIKLAAVHLASDWWNGNAFISQWFHFQGFL